ncbi:SIS domain-containing protein [Psychromarinibacter sp. S121]|uniref:SIS domain-containing protein n=1 Tax=Psychromarinibacter sp. S121 TaxID=3415127 RepID=UPI003C7A5860
MTDTVARYFDDLLARLTDLRDSAAAPMAAATEAVLEVLDRGGRVFVFGTGHSHTMAEETHYRAGGPAFTVPILSGPTTVQDGAVAGTVYERLPGIVAPILDRYGVGDRDMLIVVSNSGVNVAPVEAAELAKQRGAVVVAVTSEAYSAHAARGRVRIADIADIVLDNGGPAGDAAIALEGSEMRVGPVSTVIGATLLNALFADVAQRLVDRGEDVPVYRSANMEGADEINARLIAKYRDRNPHL